MILRKAIVLNIIAMHRFFYLFLSLLHFSCSSKNLGHRMGADIIKNYPENTVEGLRALLNSERQNPKLLYIEMDLQENISQDLFVFHDKNIRRLVPLTQFGNDRILSEHSENNLVKRRTTKYRFTDFSTKEIQALNLTADSIKIPKLDTVLETIKKLKYSGKVYLEIKSIESDEARNHLLKLIKVYQASFEIALIAYRDNFKASFKNKDYWCSVFKQNNIKVLSLPKHKKICTHVYCN